MKTKFTRYLFVAVTVFILPACLSVSQQELTEAGSSSNASLLKPIAASYNRTCVLSRTGVLKCWGHNNEGQLGQGHTTPIGNMPGDMGTNLLPINLGTGRTAKSVSVAGLHICAILDNNKVKCWGYNGNGELGLGDTVDRGDNPNEMGDNLPYVDLGTGRTAKAISAGGSHTCALLDNDDLKCWGYNNDGELGYEDMNNRGDAAGEMGDNLPVVNVGTNRKVKNIASGGHHTCAILDNNKVKCWGHNGFGSLGLGDSIGRGHWVGSMGDNLPYVNLGTGRTAKVVTIGDFFNCSLLDNNTVKCWGRNEFGQLGLGDTNDRGDAINEMGDDLPVVSLGTGLKATVISTMATHACVILNDESVKCWGRNNAGQLGQGNTDHLGMNPGEMGNNLPTVNLGTGVRAMAIAAGHEHSCSILSDYSVKCWGTGWHGVMGNETDWSEGDTPAQMGDNLPIVNLGF